MLLLIILVFWETSQTASNTTLIYPDQLLAVSSVLMDIINPQMKSSVLWEKLTIVCCIKLVLQLHVLFVRMVTL